MSAISGKKGCLLIVLAFLIIVAIAYMGFGIGSDIAEWSRKVLGAWIGDHR